MIKLIKNICFAVLFMLITLSCNSTATDDLVNGDALNRIIDTSPPLIVHPVKGQITGLVTTLEWVNTAGTDSYTLKIGSDEDMNDPLLDEELVFPNNKYTFHAPESRTYYWQIYSNQTDGLIPVNSFEATDCIYVNGDSLYEGPPSGTKNRPYTSITEAVNAADSLNVDVRVSASSMPYIEDVFILKGINLYGGYNKDTWERDTQSNETVVQGETDLGMVIAYISINTVVDGFTIKANNGHDASAVTATISSPKVILSNNIIEGGVAQSGRSNGLLCTERGNITVNNNIISGGESASSSHAIHIDNSSPKVMNNIIYGGSAQFLSFAVMTNRGSPDINNNIIHGGISEKSYGIYSQISTISLKNNTIYSGLGSTWSIGIASQHHELMGELVYEAQLYVNNNIIFCSGNAVGYGFYEYLSDANPVEFNNNNIFNCNAALYANFEEANINDNNASGDLDEELDVLCLEIPPSGNKTLKDDESATDIFADTFNLNDISTWGIQGNGLADLDNSGSWTQGDSGANVLTVGPQ